MTNCGIIFLEVVCYNGGVLVGSVCQCPPPYEGNFCERETQSCVNGYLVGTACVCYNGYQGYSMRGADNRAAELCVRILGWYPMRLQ